MDFERCLAHLPHAARPTRCIAVFALCLSGCAHSDPRRFPLAAPIVRDQDLDNVALTCRNDGSKVGSPALACYPDDYESSFAWDAADNLIFRPISKFFQVDTYGESENVNALDEVPDSSWFTNRIGARAISPEEVGRGYCGEGAQLSSDPRDGAWTIDHGKDNGANPGFRVNVAGTKFMLKTDDDVPERATAATAIASRLYYAAGWWAPCDSVVYFKRSALRLEPGLTIKANVGPPKIFDQSLLGSILAKTARRGDRYRAAASRWLPGRTLGPFTYEGQRADDPSDVIPHENRRDLRGARVIAAWLNHFDSREQNTMSTWMPADANASQSPGYVRHWYIDLGDCFGSEWSVDGFSRRHGQSYVLDVGYMLEDFGSFGTVERPWERAARTPGYEIFGYFSSRDFQPEMWRGEYPNPSFGRMTEHDGAWAARILSRFTAAHIEAAVRAGDLSNRAHAEYLTRVLIERLHAVLERYFAKLSPLTDVRTEGGSICLTDLARKTSTYPADRFRYEATVARGGNDPLRPAVDLRAEGELCLSVRGVGPSPSQSAPDDAIERYVIVRIKNGATPGPIVLHFYDLGPPRGLRLVGVERPDESARQ